MKLSDFRQQYPQYDDMSDEQLADSLHEAHYSDIDKGEFYSQIGLESSPDYNWLRNAGRRASSLGKGIVDVVKEGGDYLESKFPESAMSNSQIVFGGDFPYVDIKSNKEAEAAGVLNLDDTSEYLGGQDFGYKPNYTVDKLLDSSGVIDGAGNTLGMVKEQGVSSLIDMAALAFSAPLYLAGRSGEIGAARAENNNKELELSDIVEGAPAAIASVALDKVALGKLGKGGVATGAATEGATEAVQEGLIEYAGETLFTEKELSAEEAGKRALGGLILGGATGGAVAGTSKLVDAAVKKTKSLEIDAEQSDQSAEDMSQADWDAFTEKDLNAEGEPQKTPNQLNSTEYQGNDEVEAKEWSRAKAKGLDMSNEARIQRAQDMGFDTNTTYYHGTDKNFEAFSKDKIGSRFDGYSFGIYVTSNPKLASSYAKESNEIMNGGNVTPLYVKKPINELTFETDGQQPDFFIDINRKEIISKVLESRKEGNPIDSVMAKNSKTGTEVRVLFEPSHIRSVNAAFDPDFRETPDLLASKSPEKTKEKSNLEIRDHVVDAQNDQIDSKISAYDGDTLAGTIEYSEFNGEPAIKMVEISDNYKRQGIATKLINEIQSKYPDVEIDVGMLTEDGAAWYNSLPKETVYNEEYRRKSKELDAVKAKLSEYSTLTEKFNQKERSQEELEQYRDSVKDWNDLHDRAEDLQQELDQIPEKRTILTKKQKPIVIAEPKSFDVLKNIDTVKAYVKDKFSGKTFKVLSDGRDVSVKSVSKLFSGKLSKDKLLVATKLDDVIANSKYQSSQPDRKNRQSVIAIHNYRSDNVEIGGREVEVSIIVREQTDGNLYYDHVVVGKKNVPNEKPAGGTKPFKSDMRNQTAPNNNTKKDVYESSTLPQPMPNYVPTLAESGMPSKPIHSAVFWDGKPYRMPTIEKPMRAADVEREIVKMMERPIYRGNIKSKYTLGFYKPKISELRVRNYNDIEVTTHEMAHFLDFHSSYKGMFRRLYKQPSLKSEVANLSYTSDPKLQSIEGFAEYVRLWTTQYDQALRKAPKFTVAFENLIRKDKKAFKDLIKIQKMAHAYYHQGDAARLRAKQGESKGLMNRIGHITDKTSAEIVRQNFVDQLHGAKVVERELGVFDGSFESSPYQQFRIAKGGWESIADAAIEDGTPKLNRDGSISFSGKGLNAIFGDVKNDKAKFDKLMDFFMAKRGQELKSQGRENLLADSEILAGLEYGAEFKEFEGIFNEYQKFNERMLDFYVQTGLLTSKQKEAFQEMNKNYVPFNRVYEGIELLRRGDYNGFKRLTGGTQNTKDIAVNITEGVRANIRMAMLARAKQTLYQNIASSEDGSKFAVEVSAASQMVNVDAEQMSETIGKALVMLEADTNGQGIRDILDENPNLLSFFTGLMPPKTQGAMLDTVTINGEKRYFEIRDPLLADMMNMMSPKSWGSALATMQAVKGFHTRAITSMPQFALKNAIRDTMAASINSKNGYIPLLSTIRGFQLWFENGETRKLARLNGLEYGTRVAADTEEGKARARLDVHANKTVKTLRKVAKKYDEIIGAFEMASRLAEFELAIKNGKSAAEAAFDGREVSTDFSIRGGSKSVQGLTSTVSFMNASLQGLDQVARRLLEIDGEMSIKNIHKFDEAKRRYVLNGLMYVTIPSLLIAIINNESEDERYAKLTTDQKQRDHYAFIGSGEPVRIPKAFTQSDIFATPIELLVDEVYSNGDADSVKVLKHLAVEQISFANEFGDFAPSAFKPLYEAFLTNENFLDVPIVPYYMDNLKGEDKKYQYKSSTKETYKAVGDVLGMSPLELQHLTRGYLGYLESLITHAVDKALWDEEAFGEMPFAKSISGEALRGFGTQGLKYRNEYTDRYYELRTDAISKYSTRTYENKRLKSGESQKSDFLQSPENKVWFSIKRVFDKEDRRLRENREKMDLIKYDKRYTRDQKEQKIDALLAENLKIQEKAVEYALKQLALN